MRAREIDVETRLDEQLLFVSIDPHGEASTIALASHPGGSGDGGIYSTAADFRSLWTAFFAELIVSQNWVEQMVRPRSVPSASERYGLGFWLHASTDTVMLEGIAAGVSFRSVHDPRSDVTHTVISNTTDGAWPVTRFLAEQLGT